MKKNDRPPFSYDIESDVLSWELNDKPVVYAKEMGNVVIHFSQGHAPVFVEVLEATKLLTNALGILEKSGVSLPRPLPAFPHFIRADSSR